MKRTILFIFLGVFTHILSQAQSEKPKLVVGIIVDQMRQEYLYRFENRFGEDGFKKLMNEGFMFKNAHYNYIPTKTGPGHTSVYTGTTPSTHGIIANDWWDKKQGKYINCVGDDRFNTIGSDSKHGEVSIKNLLSTTITDELMLFTQSRSLVYGISLKDRCATLPAGHGGQAFWYDKDNGKFITSSYYLSELPNWIKEFNNRKLADKYLSMTWNTLYDIDTYKESSPDKSAGEKGIRSLNGEFPYDMTKLDLNYENVIEIPYGNDLLTDFAIETLDKVDFGKDQYTDFLAISYSATDYIGHGFGPYSVEVEDTYLRLDRNIATLIKKLDEKVGKGNYTLFLTADHAVAAIPTYLEERKFGVGYFNKDESVKALSAALVEKYGNRPWIDNVSNEQVFLNHDSILASNIDIEEISQFIVNYFLKLDAIANAFTAREVREFAIVGNDLKSQLARGFNPARSGDIILVLQPGWLRTSSTSATNHSTGYNYDTHVPLLWYGNSIKKGSSVKYHPITDIAPTLSMMLEIGLPSGATGQPLYELFDQQ
ncbi:MAG TPA: alkaline phosphatase family protein [Fulvivirga sp.]|nr:alkaline phosphatase family protein [Fulvivirga sp.]